MRDWVYIRTGYLLEAAVCTGREATLPCVLVVKGGCPTGGLHTRAARGEGEGEHAEDLPLPSSSNMLTEYPQSPLFIGIISQCNISCIIFQMVMQDNISLYTWLYNILLCIWLYHIFASGLLYITHLRWLYHVLCSLLYNIFLWDDYITYTCAVII